MNVLQLAIDLEEQLEQYYLDQAKQQSEQGLASVFQLLAREERKHAELLRKHASKLDGLTIKQTDILDEVKVLFTDLLSVRSDLKTSPDQIDVYQFAQTKETDSIVAYEKLLAQAVDEVEREVFSFLIGEEKKHYRILGAIIDFVSRPEEWIEDAEFGLRKEY